MENSLIDPKYLKFFIFAGKAIFTILNTVTGNRFTFRVQQLDEYGLKKDIWFVSVLSGSNNETDYTFLGTVKQDDMGYKYYVHSKKSRAAEDAPSVRAFIWF
jgi:hypothetical protein